MTLSPSIVCNMIQVDDQQFPTLNASSIKRAHVGNNSRLSGNSKVAFLFKKTPYSKSAIPVGRSPYPTFVSFVKRDSNQKRIHPNGGAISPNLEFYEKRIPYQKMVLPPKRISLALYNGVPDENTVVHHKTSTSTKVVLYNNRSARQNLVYPSRIKPQNVTFYGNRAPIGYPLRKRPLAFHKNRALLQKLVAFPKENRAPIPQTVTLNGKYLWHSIKMELQIKKGCPP
ncbi:hypothetical protein ACH5RR_003116 [Cinchona calisaya]|uniref:Uncharacterized protein n=1 Tax=Cinchona calisaya TaxID=153742 RepID=A0ABD3ATV8_9GENT